MKCYDADATTKAIASRLEPYAAARPHAEVDVYRFSEFSVRVRVIDPDFRGQSRTARHKAVWPLLEPLDEEQLEELGMLLLIPPEDKDRSAVNREFEAGLSAKAVACDSAPTRVVSAAQP